MSEIAVLFTRDLPGGGFVAIARGIMRWQAARRRDGGRSDAIGREGED